MSKLVIIPTYNEKENIEAIVKAVFSQKKAFDILIVDEALSVGDNYFQHKSFDRIRAYNKLGTTLLIVSHDKGQKTESMRYIHRQRRRKTKNGRASLSTIQITQIKA